jgi:PAS domain S-box-containing protein
MLNPELQKSSVWQNEERYSQMIDEIQDYAIILLSPEGIIQNWNTGAHKIKGYTADEIIGQSLQTFYTPEDKAKQLPQSLLDEARLNGRALHEGWRIRKDGSRFWGSIVITALHDKNANVTGFMKITRDLTERKEAEDRQLRYTQYLEEQRRAEERYHKMIDEIQDYAILLLDKDGNIQNWNTGAEKIKGYTAEDIIGKNFSIFYTSEDRASNLPFRLLGVAKDTGRATHEGWRVRKDGTKFWGSIVITALHNDNNEVIGYSKVTRDLTERKLAEDRLKQYALQLEQKNQELEEFSYVASHDLKEPLRKIVTFGDLLQHNVKDSTDEKMVNYVVRMQDAARRMMQLIEDLLEFSLIGKREQSFEPTDLNHVLEHVLQDVEGSIQKQHAVVNADTLPTLVANPLQMHQLFQNLVSNALKFNDKEKPVISITYKPAGTPDNPAHEIRVHDNGIGFEPAEATRIFEAFRRLHGRLEYAGSGIGLAICKKIVELHHGAILATGEKEKGATFIITLPNEQPASIS